VIQVLDASIVVRWFAPEGDADDAVAERMLRQLARRSRDFVVPELLGYEVVAVLVRKLRSADLVARAMRRLDRFGLRRVRLDPPLVEATGRLALRFRVTGYDAAYLAVAEALGGRWLTLDAAAHARVVRSGLATLAT